MGANAMSFEFHDLANLFPLMEGADFDSLVADIRESGQRELIVLFEEKILDGRNRYRACMAVGVEPKTTDYSGTDPIKFVLSMNLHRRHLNASQRALIAAELSNMTRGNPDWSSPIVEKTTIGAPQGKLAETMNVNRSTVNSGKLLLKEGTPDQIKAVRAGKASVTMIAREIRANRSEAEKAEKQTENVKSHTERMQMQSEIYNSVRDGLEALCGQPKAADVVKIIRGRKQLEKVIGPKIQPALNWLKEFADAWERHDGQS
jgi:hypothetical protein